MLLHEVFHTAQTRAPRQSSAFGPRLVRRTSDIEAATRSAEDNQTLGEFYLGRFAFTLVPLEAQWVKHGTQRRQPRRVDHEYLPAAVRSVISFQPPAC